MSGKDTKDIENFSLHDLKARLKAYGKSTMGSREDLVIRLTALETEKRALWDHMRDEYAHLSTQDIRGRLVAFGKNTDGTRDELVARLKLAELQKTNVFGAERARQGELELDTSGSASDEGTDGDELNSSKKKLYSPAPQRPDERSNESSADGSFGFAHAASSPTIKHVTPPIPVETPPAPTPPAARAPPALPDISAIHPKEPIDMEPSFVSSQPGGNVSYIQTPQRQGGAAWLDSSVDYPVPLSSQRLSSTTVHAPSGLGVSYSAPLSCSFVTPVNSSYVANTSYVGPPSSSFVAPANSSVSYVSSYPSAPTTYVSSHRYAPSSASYSSPPSYSSAYPAATTYVRQPHASPSLSFVVPAAQNTSILSSSYITPQQAFGPKVDLSMSYIGSPLAARAVSPMNLSGSFFVGGGGGGPMGASFMSTSYVSPMSSSFVSPMSSSFVSPMSSSFVSPMSSSFAMPGGYVGGYPGAYPAVSGGYVAPQPGFHPGYPSGLSASYAMPAYGNASFNTSYVNTSYHPVNSTYYANTSYYGPPAVNMSGYPVQWVGPYGQPSGFYR